VLVASIDQVSGGGLLFRIGGSWNSVEIEAHGTVFAMRMLKMREQMEAMKEIWTRQRSNGPSRRHPANALWPRCDRRPW
jgi:alkanesulfonate monooxygenase SsuD/methylene tetrahydromethanopterin reductase-like flavin-dependent oxidoreductase (luciferase family)